MEGLARSAYVPQRLKNILYRLYLLTYQLSGFTNTRQVL